MYDKVCSIILAWNCCLIFYHIEWYREADVGKAIQECSSNPDDLVVVTKIHPRSYNFFDMQARLERSQLELYGKTRKLDVVLLHAPFCWEGHCNQQQKEFLNKKGWQQAWRNLERMHSSGMVSAIGVSNFHPHQLKELLGFSNTRVAVVQNFMVWCNIILTEHPLLS